MAEDLIPVQDAEEQSAEQKQQTSSPPSWLEASIDSLSLSIRAINALHYGGYRLIRDLCGKQAEDLLSIRNFGSKSLEELQERLSHQGIPFLSQALLHPQALIRLAAQLKQAGIH